MRSFPKIRVTLPFCVLLAIMYLLDLGNVFLPTLFAVIIHEAAHILAIYSLGARPDRIDIRARGISVNVPNMEYMSYLKEIIIAAAGPLAGIVTAGVGLLAAKFFDLHSLDFFTGINVVVTAINLVPVYPLDGGRIMLALMLKCLPLRAAYTVSYVLSALSVGALCGICIYLASIGRLNPSLVVFASYVGLCGIKAPRP